MNKMIFWGATGQAKVLRECLKPSGMELVALFDNNAERTSPFPDTPIYIGKQSFEAWVKENEANRPISFLVAIGGTQGKARMEIQQYLASFQLVPLLAKHAAAYVADDAQIGAGSQILAHATVCVEATIGRGCIVNTGATVDHECVLEEGVHICPGAHLGGCVHVERYATVGLGASVLPRITIGQGAIVGAGAVVTKDVPPGTVVAGNPARCLEKANIR